MGIRGGTFEITSATQTQNQPRPQAQLAASRPVCAVHLECPVATALRPKTKHQVWAAQMNRHFDHKPQALPRHLEFLGGKIPLGSVCFIPGAPTAVAPVQRAGRPRVLTGPRAWVPCLVPLGINVKFINTLSQYKQRRNM